MILAHPLAISLIAGAGLLMAAAPLQAQAPAQPAPVRTMLQTSAVAGSPEQETSLATVDIAVGSGNPFHTHFGSEMGYVVSGHIRLEVMGQPPRELGPGDSFLVPRGLAHRSVLVGNEPAKLVNSWTVDKGKPLMTPVAAAPAARAP